MVNYTYSKLPTINFNTTPASIARSATGSVYAIGDTTYTTPLNMTLVVGGSVVTSISSDALGMLPDFTLLDRTSCVWKQTGVSFATVLTTSDPVPGPPGASGGTGAPGAQGVPGDVSTWKSTTFYPLNTPVTNPSGDLVKVTTAHTSTGSYDASKFEATGAAATKLTGVVPDANLRPDLTVAALAATFVPRWKATTTYALGDKVVSPDGDTVTAKAAFTSGASYSAANWDLSPTIATAIVTERSYPSYAPTSTARKYDTRLNAFNLKPTNMRKWAKALSIARTGGAFARLNFYGDSLTMGGTLSPTFNQAFTWRVKEMLRTLAGVQAYEGQVMLYGKPGSGTAGSRDSTDTRVAYPATSVASTTGGLFDYCTRLPVGAADLTFTPTEQCDSFTVYYASDTGNSTFDIWADAGAHTTTSANAAAAIKTVTISAGALGNHVLRIGNITGTGSVAILAVEATTGTSGVRVSRCGLGAQRWQDINGTVAAYSSKAFAKYLAPNLSVIMLGANDYIQQTALATVESNARTIIESQMTVGDVMLVVSPPLSNVLTIPWTSYAAIIWKLADEYDLPVVDLTQRWGTYAANSTLYTDNVHPKAEGHWDMAQGVFNALTAV